MSQKLVSSGRSVRWSAAVLGCLGSLALTATGCELVGPVVDGVFKPTPSEPEPEPPTDPVCVRARQSYIDLLTGRVTFSSDEELAAAFDRGYAEAVSACGDGSVPPPPPVGPRHEGTKRDAGAPPSPRADAGPPPSKDPTDSQACSDALAAYTKLLWPGSVQPKDQEWRALLDRSYADAVAACGQDAVPPPPPFGN